MELEQLGKRAKAAGRALAVTDAAEKNRALAAVADALEAQRDALLAANAKDLENAQQSGMSAAFTDRLRLDNARVSGMAAGLRALMALPDPVGRVLEETTRPNGLRIEKVSVPLGVIGVIFEARPNVCADSAALCLKSGNAVILRGGSSALHSNVALVAVMRSALEGCGLPPDCVQLVADTSRETALALTRLKGYVDVLIPRGSAGLIRAVLETATVPVIETGAGTSHVYIHRAARLDMAADIVFNAKTSRPSVCNAAECLLVDRAVAPAALGAVEARLAERPVELRADGEAFSLLRHAVPAAPEDWGREYNDYVMAVHVVADEAEAVDFINRHGTGHSECIVTEDAAAAAYFMDNVDAAAVYHNASTRFTDGGEFGLGAEIGISTQKLHARGPLGLEELTSYKYRIYGSGQVR